MNNILVTFQRDDGVYKKTLSISVHEKFGIYRKEIQTILGLRDNIDYELILKRTGKSLLDSLTPIEVGIISGDEIILYTSMGVPNSNPAKSTFSQVQVENSFSPKLLVVAYSLQLTVLSDNQQTISYQYLVELNEFHEDNPHRFFSNSNAQEKQNFRAVLEKELSDKISLLEVERILQEWCEDISLGYRNTSVKVLFE